MLDCSVIPPAFRSSISAPTCRRHGRRVRRSCYCRRCLSCSSMRREASCVSIRRCPIGCRTPSCRRSRRCGGRPANEHRLARRRRQVFLLLPGRRCIYCEGTFPRDHTEFGSGRPLHRIITHYTRGAILLSAASARVATIDASKSFGHVACPLCQPSPALRLANSESDVAISANQIEGTVITAAAASGWIRWTDLGSGTHTARALSASITRPGIW
jgi:hypothetical protein